MSSKLSNRALGLAIALGIVTLSARARAVDLPSVRDEPVKLDVTNVSIFTRSPSCCRMPPLLPAMMGGHEG